mgnify:CR=1 FL=1
MFNEGEEPLTITELIISNSHFLLSYTVSTIDPGSVDTLTVRFTPEDENEETGVLTILSDDPIKPELTIGLSGSGLMPPDIDVTPSEISVSLLSGEASVHELTISNTGASDLEWGIVFEYPERSTTSGSRGDKNRAGKMLKQPNSIRSVNKEIGRAHV